MGMKLRLPPRLRQLIRGLIAEEGNRRGVITGRGGLTTYIRDTDVDTPSLKIGGVTVITNDRTLQNVSSLGLRPVLDFDGVDDYVEVPHSDTLNLNVLTVMAWFKSTYSGGWFRTIVAKYGYTYVCPSWGLGWIDTNKLGFYIRDADGTENRASAPTGEGLDGRWHHLAGVASDTKVQFWMDGVLKMEVDRTAGDIRNTRPVTLARHSDQYVPECISEVLIYNRALSEDEIRWNYLHPNNPVRDGLVLWLKMDEGKGDKLIDYSGNDNYGTIYGATWVYDKTPIGLDHPVNPYPTWKSLLTLLTKDVGDYLNLAGLRIGGTEVIDSSRNIKNVADAYVGNNLSVGGAILHGESIFRNGMKLVEAEKVGLGVRGIAILNPEGELVAVITDKGDLLIRGEVRGLEEVG